VIGTISMVVWGYVSDRMQERKWNLFVGCLVGAIGLIIAGLIGGSFWSLAAMCLATIGFYGSKGPFWPLPSTFLTGTAAAAGMALINSVGNVGGFMGPFFVGWIKDPPGISKTDSMRWPASCCWQRLLSPQLACTPRVAGLCLGD
jgi:ACS family tartrate transporter-like MFS transporter